MYITIHPIINKIEIMRTYCIILALISFLGVLISILAIATKKKDDDVGAFVFILIASIITLIEVSFQF